MQDINALIAKNFDNNISYLQENQRELFAKLSALESAIANGYYQERYELRHDNGYFDVYEKDTGRYLYAKDSYKYASLAAQSIDYELHENLFKGFHDRKISDEELKKFSQMPPFEHEMSGHAPIMHYVQQYSQKEKLLKSIDKFVFFGAGLGLHVGSVHKKISAKAYLVIEDDLELFRLSLFVTDYASIAKDAKLFFSVFEEKEDFLQTAAKFLKYEYYYNHYIKFFHMLSHSEEKIEEFQLTVASQSHLLFYYNTLLTQLLAPLKYVLGDYMFLGKTTAFDTKELGGVPFLVLGAGPSLEKNKEWLKHNRERFVIVAVSATLQFLENEEIRPDIVVHLDAFDTSLKFFDNVRSVDFLKDTLFFFSDRLSLKIIERLNKENIFFFENGTTYKESSLKPSATCVGSITYQILLFLKAKSIYLLGVDLAIDSQTGNTHSSSHIYANNISIEEHTKKSDLFTYDQTLISVDGNLRDKALTTAQLYTSIESMNLSTKLLKKEYQNVYNLSDGAKFTDIEPKQTESLDIQKALSKKDIHKAIYQICLKNSSRYITPDELKNLQNKLSHAKKAKEIVKGYDFIKNVSPEEYLKSLSKLVKDLTSESEKERYELCRVIDTYLQYVLGYIFDFFNGKDLKEADKHIRDIHDILRAHLLEIVDHYIKEVSAKLKHS